MSARIIQWSIGLLASSMAIAVGCGGSEGSGGAGGGSATSATATTGTSVTGATTVTSSGTGTSGSTGAGGPPTITLTLPSDTLTSGAMVTATVSVTDFVLEAPNNQQNQAGHGHYHIYLDGASGGNYLVANQVPSVTFTIPASTTPGAHSLKVSLSDNHHVPLTPPVEDVVAITVQ